MHVYFSLPQEQIQGIKRMVTMYFMHSLFLTYTQIPDLYLHDMHSSIYTMYKQSFIKAPWMKTIPLYLLGGPASCLCWQISIHPGPQTGNNCPTPWFLSLSPLSHSTILINYLRRQHQQLQSSSTGTYIHICPPPLPRHHEHLCLHVCKREQNSAQCESKIFATWQLLCNTNSGPRTFCWHVI
jgi:hypothetical protein